MIPARIAMAAAVVVAAVALFPADGPAQTKIETMAGLAEKGDVQSQYELGLRYGRGVGVEKDLNEAEKWFTRAAEGGHALAQYNAALLKSQRKDRHSQKEAVRWYIASAEQGFVDAQYDLGMMYGRGTAVPRDYRQSAHWFLRAATQGHERSQSALAYLYRKGLGVEADRGKALEWWEKSAEGGFREAQYLLGTELLKTAITEVEEKDAAKWIRAAALQRHASAQYTLGVLHSKGQGVAWDYAEAWAWISLAGDSGYRAAAKALQQLERQMNDLQKARAQEAKSVFRAEQNKAIAEARKRAGRN
jgi:TPR repeat protein